MRTIKTSIADAAFLKDPRTRAVMDALSSDGDTAARFVGGCVRNSLLGRHVDDVDIATRLKPQDVMARTQAAGLKPVATGLAHGTVTVVSGGKPFEVTTLRIDVNARGRHADVAFTEDWAADAARRDFTINAIYADRDGAVFDSVGGLGDLAAGRVVFIGEAKARIREDFLRILRFFRIHAWYGEGPFDETGLAATAAESAGLDTLSGERIQAELLKLLAAYDPLAALRAMVGLGILARLLVPPFDLDGLARLVRAEQSGLDEADSLRRLAVLLGPGAACAEITRLRFSNAQKDRLARLRSMLAEEPLSATLDARLLRRLRHIEGPSVRDRIVLSAAAEGRDAADPAWRHLLALAAQLPDRALPVNGHDLIALGARGELIGHVLAALEGSWIASDFALSREELASEARALISAGSP